MDELSSRDISAAVTPLGWRYILGALVTAVPVDSLAIAARVAERVAELDEVAGNLRVDLRPDRLVLVLQTFAAGEITPKDLQRARRIAATLRDLGCALDPGVADGVAPRSVQLVEIGVDALDIARVRPFWRALLGYADEADRTGPTDPLVDPYGQGPAVWFQQMSEPRPQRNRIHLDVSVPHDEARHRLDAVLAAGGHLVSDQRAPAFWVVADAEGNEACITTWQGRD
jgi:4a-hydroxytetrahydrobiopterin dehydratase